MTALKPCPACGGEARPVRDREWTYVRCEAHDCIGTRAFFGVKHESCSVALWNSLPRRDDKPAQPARDDERRFRAAVAAMQGLLASGLDHGVASAAIFHADALLAAMCEDVKGEL